MNVQKKIGRKLTRITTLKKINSFFCHRLKLALICGSIFVLSVFLPACQFKPFQPPPPPPVKNTQKSVVKIFATSQNVDFAEPWKPGSEFSLEGCGCILNGGRVLTTGHLVDKANYIEVQKFGETKRYVAKVEKLACDLDLALLSVEDKDFPVGTEPVEFGDLPQPGDKVVLQGGDELSKKEDTISGLDMVWSWEAETGVPALLTGSEIDEKLQGCPVLKNGKFVGLPFSAWHKDEKVGMLVPVTMVAEFLRAVEGGRDYPGLADLGLDTQNLKSPDLRAYYRLPPDKSGVVVTQVLYGGSSVGILKEGDVITAVDGHAVDNEGYTFLDKLGRVSVDYLISLKLPGDTLNMDVFRGGQPLKLQVPIGTEPKLVPYRPDNRHPTYYMNAGFVFVPLTYNYLSMDWNNMKPELKDLSNRGVLGPERKQVVVLSHVLPADINEGYHYFTNIIVDKVNGRPVTGMKDLVEDFAHPEGKYDVIEFDDHSWTGSVIVFDARKAKKATRDIMRDLSIPADRSDDLK